MATGSDVVLWAPRVSQRQGSRAGKKQPCLRRRRNSTQLSWELTIVYYSTVADSWVELSRVGVVGVNWSLWCNTALKWYYGFYGTILIGHNLPLISFRGCRWFAASRRRRRPRHGKFAMQQTSAPSSDSWINLRVSRVRCAELAIFFRSADGRHKTANCSIGTPQKLLLSCSGDLGNCKQRGGTDVRSLKNARTHGDSYVSSELAVFCPACCWIVSGLFIGSVGSALMVKTSVLTSSSMTQRWRHHPTRAAAHDAHTVLSDVTVLTDETDASVSDLIIHAAPFYGPAAARTTPRRHEGRVKCGVIVQQAAAATENLRDRAQSLTKAVAQIALGAQSATLACTRRHTARCTCCSHVQYFCRRLHRSSYNPHQAVYSPVIRDRWCSMCDKNRRTRLRKVQLQSINSSLATPSLDETSLLWFRAMSLPNPSWLRAALNVASPRSVFLSHTKLRLTCRPKFQWRVGLSM